MISKSYKTYIQGYLFLYFKKVATVYILILLAMAALYITKYSIIGNITKANAENEQVEISSKKSTALSSNKAVLENEFSKLSNIQKENKLNGRQYMIESITNAASSAGLVNFVINQDGIVQKNQDAKFIYSEVSNKIDNLAVYEITASFYNALDKQFYDFITLLNSSVNGFVLVKSVETKRMDADIKTSTLQKINLNGSGSILSNNVVLHWFFV